MSSPHLDLDRLADLLAGEGTDADVAHVGGCSGCAGRLDELSVAEVEVAAALAALPAPALPPALAERLTAALAAEPPLAPSAPAWAQAPTPTSAEGSRTVTPFPGAAARRERRWAPLGAAAALVLVVGGLGGAVALSGRDGGDDTGTSAMSGGGGDAAEESTVGAGVPTSSSGNDYATEGSLAAALAGVLAGGAARQADDLAAQPAAPSADALGATRSASPEGTSADAADPLARLRDPAELASCLSGLLPPDDTTVLALDYARYAGEPALTVVLPATGAPDKVDVFVVGAGCTAGDDQTRFFTRLDRPAG